MRLFVCIRPAQHALEDLEEFLASRRGVDGPRWTPSDQWHVTLAFCANAPEHVLEPLSESLAGVAARHPRLPLSVRGGGCFPDTTRARVLWAGLEGGDALAPVAAGVRSACSVVGAGPEGGPFRPHMTLARFPRPLEATRWLRVLDTYRGPTWTAETIEVVRSHLPSRSRGRVRHEGVATIALSARSGVDPTSGERPRQDSNLRPRD